MKFARPALVSLRWAMHFSAAATLSTTILSRLPQAVLIATSYSAGIVPKSPSLPWKPAIIPVL